MTTPRYQDVSGKDIPEVIDDDGTQVRIVCGDFWGKRGPVEGVAADPRYLDISVPPGERKRLAVENARHAFAYVFAGSGTFRDASEPRGVLTEASAAATRTAIDQTGNRSLVLFDRGDEIVVQAGEEGIRFLLVSGKPIEEPVAWYGPIVMNTQARAAAGISRIPERDVHQTQVANRRSQIAEIVNRTVVVSSAFCDSAVCDSAICSSAFCVLRFCAIRHPHLVAASLTSSHLEHARRSARRRALCASVAHPHSPFPLDRSVKSPTANVLAACLPAAHRWLS